MPDADEIVAQAVADIAGVVAQAAQNASNIAALIDAQNNLQNQGGSADTTSGVTSRGQEPRRFGATKIQAKVPWFTGEHPTYTWESFVLALEISELNEVYSDAERKQMLLQNLDGSARMFLLANKSLLHKNYAEIKDAFAKRFASKKTHSLTQLRAMQMQPKEKVLRWYARILAVGDNIVASDTVGVTDPVRLAQIQGSRDTLDLILMDQFKKGLNPAVRAQMKAETFANIEACVKAAEEAEEFLQATEVQTNFVGAETVASEEVSVNFATGANTAFGQVQSMNGRAPLGGAKDSGSKEKWLANAKCYNCDNKGHLARDCPQPAKPRDGQKGTGGKKKGNKKSKKDTTEANNVVTEQLNAITKKLEEMSASGRGSRSRSSSRSRRHSRHRSSSRRSRDSSHSRSRSHSRRRSHRSHKVSYAASSKN